MLYSALRGLIETLWNVNTETLVLPKPLQPFNRNIVEYKWHYTGLAEKTYYHGLIETLWNVNGVIYLHMKWEKIGLIETLWNVN